MSETKVLQLKITLCEGEIGSPIWREVLVKDDINLQDLHQIIQILFEWEGGENYQLTVRGTEYEDDSSLGLSHDAYDYKDTNKTILQSLKFKKGSKFTYKYHFAEDWDHNIEVEKVLPYELNECYPVCINGARNTPPEECGGGQGYNKILEILADENYTHYKKHPDYDDYNDYEAAFEWMSEDFDSEEFDIAGINSVLAKGRYGTKAENELREV